MASTYPRPAAERKASYPSFRTQDVPPDPDRGLVAQSCLDLLLIELVSMAQRTANELQQRSLRASGEISSSDENENPPEPPPKDPHTKQKKKGKRPPSLDAEQSQSQRFDDDELQGAAFHRLEAVGYRVGLGVVESLSSTHALISPTTFLTTPPPPSPSNPSAQPNTSKDNLDIIKFICKDVWTHCFRKQIDNLKTNHRGVFVLTDMRFEPLKRASLPTNKPLAEAHRRAGMFLAWPTGLIRGCLSGLGLEAGVGGEVAGVGLPGAVFTIRVGGAGGGSSGGGGGK